MARPKGSFKQPSYRHHKATGLSVVTLDDRDYYCGEWAEPPAGGIPVRLQADSPASWKKYNRYIADWRLAGCQGPTASNPETCTVDQLIAAYVPHAVNAAGRLHSNVKHSMTWLSGHFGDVLTSDFTSQNLRALRERMTVEKAKRGKVLTDRNLSRKYVNRMVRFIVAAFAWGEIHGMVPTSALGSLVLVKPLKRGKSSARETGRVMDVDQQHVDAVLAIASPAFAAMIRIQLLTGARPGEIRMMRGAELIIRRDEPVWEFRPTQYKGKHLDLERVIWIGPKGQEVLRPFLKFDPEAYVFSPADNAARLDAERTRQAMARTERKWAYENQQSGKVPAGIKHAYYKDDVYATGISHLCDRADRIAHQRDPSVPAGRRIVPRWHPHQLRHNAATNIAEEFGPEYAQHVLGHTSLAMTAVYAHLAKKNQRMAREVMAKRG